ncbi:60S ribosomal protein L6 [Trichonephila clavipes]|nr:60S ribosomal protein L6 [Trichonephila clavipes]
MPAMVGYLNHWATAALLQISENLIAFTPRQPVSSVERLANQRLHLARDEVSDWLDAQCSMLAAFLNAALEREIVNIVWPRMAEPAKKDEGAEYKRPYVPRIVLPGGVTRYNRSKSLWCVRRQLYKLRAKGIAIPEPKPEFIIKPIGGEKNGGTRKVYLRKEKRLYATEGGHSQIRRFRKKKKLIDYSRYLRKTITPGTVLIMLAGKHRGKRVVFLKQLAKTGLLLVTGPYKINGCPLRRVNQNYVMATSTKLDISSVKIPEHLDDKYFRRQRPPKKSKKDEEEIFETKKKGYVLTEQRKKDQVEVDTQIISIIRKHPEKKTMLQYLRAMFYLRNHMYPHKMKF